MDLSTRACHSLTLATVTHSLEPGAHVVDATVIRSYLLALTLSHSKQFECFEMIEMPLILLICRTIVGLDQCIFDLKKHAVM